MDKFSKEKFIVKTNSIWIFKKKFNKAKKKRETVKNLALTEKHLQR